MKKVFGSVLMIFFLLFHVSVLSTNAQAATNGYWKLNATEINKGESVTEGNVQANSNITGHSYQISPGGGSMSTTLNWFGSSITVSSSHTFSIPETLIPGQKAVIKLGVADAGSSKSSAYISHSTEVNMWINKGGIWSGFSQGASASTGTFRTEDNPDNSLTKAEKTLTFTVPDQADAFTAHFKIQGGSAPGPMVMNYDYIFVKGDVSKAAVQPTSHKTLQGSCYIKLKAFLDRYNKAKFSKVVSLGNLETYRAALADVKIVIDPKMSAKGKYDPKNNTMYLPRDPNTVKPGDSMSMGETIWHELTHKIENNHKDVGLMNSDAYAERNTEYMTHIARSALPLLEKMENDKNANAAKTRKYWNMFLSQVNSANNLPEVKQYPPDSQLMKTWFGFKCKPYDIKIFYKNGGGGSRIKNAI